MPTDLESAIRSALRADEITADQLIHPEMRVPQPRRTAARWGAVAAAAAVVVLAVVLAATTTGGHRGTDAGGGFADIVGYRWAAVSLTDATGELTIPARLHAEINYTPDHHVQGDDSLNGLYGKARATADGYTLPQGSSSTAVGSTGGDPVAARVRSAVDAMFYRVDSDDPAVNVAVALSGNTLVLRTGHTTLTLRRAGKQGVEAPASPTSTRTG